MDLRIDTRPDLDAYAAKWRRAPQAMRAEMQATMQRSVLMVETQGKANAPVKTGTLRRSITSTVRGGAGSVVGTVGTNVPYAKAVHDGSRAHVIVPVRAKALFWPGAAHPVRRVNHPGTRPNPFLKNALAQRRGAILALWRGIGQRVMARMG